MRFHILISLGRTEVDVSLQLENSVHFPLPSNDFREVFLCMKEIKAIVLKIPKSRTRVTGQEEVQQFTIVQGV